jgi:hypothetical protein
MLHDLRDARSFDLSFKTAHTGQRQLLKFWTRYQAIFFSSSVDAHRQLHTVRETTSDSLQLMTDCLWKELMPLRLIRDLSRVSKHQKLKYQSICVNCVITECQVVVRCLEMKRKDEADEGKRQTMNH